MAAIVPSDPSVLADDKVHTAAVLEDIFKRGLDLGETGSNAKPVRNCVGCNHDEWRAYDQPSGLASKWNPGCLFVLAYLTHAPDVGFLDDDVPMGLGIDVVQKPLDLIDFHDICLAIASNWRRNPFNGMFSRATRVLEMEIATAIKEQCPTPDHPNTAMVIDICSVLSYIWAQEYLLENVIPLVVEEAPEFENEHLLEEWTKEQRSRALLAKITMKRQLLGACVFPGELERYARENGGIFASDLATAIEDTRPYVAHKALVETCETLDLTYGCGVLVMYMVNRFMMANLKFPWAIHNVFIDREFMTHEKHMKVKHRTHPWIILMGNHWHIVHKDKAWRTTCPYRAVLLWFRLLETENDEAENRFYMGWESWDLSLLKFPPRE